MEHKNQAGQRRKHAQHAEGHALGQHHAQIRADLKAHEQKHQQPYDGGNAAAGDGPKGGGQRVLHRLRPVIHDSQLLTVAVHQDNGVVHGQRQLQYGGHARRHVGDLAQKIIRAQVQRYGHSDGHEEQQRLKIAVAGQQQDQQDDAEGHGVHREGNLRGRGIVVGDSRAELLPQRALQLCLLRRVIAVFRGQHVQRPIALVVIRAIWRIGHGRHVGQFFQFLEALRPLLGRKASEHGANGTGVLLFGEFRFHQAHARPHLRILRQVFGHVGVDLDSGDQNAANRGQNQGQRKNPPPPPDDPASCFSHRVSFLPSLDLTNDSV